MRPDDRMWRKHQREALKGVPRGRRATHKVETQEPQRGSSWQRRHPGMVQPWSPWYVGGGA